MGAALGWGALAASSVVIGALLGCARDCPRSRSVSFTALGFAVAASIQSIISAAADPTTQGKTMGAVSGLQSLMAVLAPVLSAPLLGIVSHLPQGDWRIGMPFYFCAVLQAAALGLAWMHFNKAGLSPPAASPRTT